jgi:hypothetical protein
MFILPLLILGMTGCGPGGDGLGEVHSTADAPWSMDAASTFIWNPADGNDGSIGASALFISVGALDCSELGQTAKGVRERKRGLVFQLAYQTHKDPQTASPAWDGLYLTGGADSLGQVVGRNLSVDGWKDGSIYSIDGESWVQVDEGNQTEFRGSFATPWWSGTFSADVCGGSEAGGSDTDTGE